MIGLGGDSLEAKQLLALPALMPAAMITRISTALEVMLLLLSSHI